MQQYQRLLIPDFMHKQISSLHKYLYKMGNTCCSDVPHEGLIEKSIQLKTNNSDELITAFFLEHPNIEQINKDKKPLIKNQFNKKIVKEQAGTYIGQTNNNQKQGKGIMLYQQGFYYEGQWKNGDRCGYGRLIYSDGDYYEGEWVDNEPTGQGIYQCTNPKRKYIGKWLNGLQHGKGKQYYQDNSIYQGDFFQGKKHGKGKLIYADGTFYEGQFKDNLIQGKGEHHGKKHKYAGQWLNNKMEGIGKSQWLSDDGQVLSTYIGQYKNGVKHGFGQYRWPNGKVYKGQWQNGTSMNKGVIVNHEDKGNQKVQ